MIKVSMPSEEPAANLMQPLGFAHHWLCMKANGGSVFLFKRFPS